VQPERPLDRFVLFRTRTVLTLLLILLVVGVVLWTLWIARHVVVWVLISVFLALALNPLVEWLQRRGIRRRGLAAAAAYVLAFAAVAGIAAAFVPTLVDQVNSFAHKVPDYLDDLTKGRGRLGFLETRYHVVEKVRSAVESGGVHRFATGAGTAIAITRGIFTAIAAIVTIVFMTFFMVLEGPAWMERLYSLLPERSQPRWRNVGREIYRTVGGYVSGNLLISLVAGVSSGIVLFAVGVPYAVALGLLVALLDLIPLAGATIAAIVVVLVAIAAQGATAAIVVGVFFVVYQQLENHLLQPLVYGRTVQLSPLAALIAVLLGAEVAGVLGALGAIPIAGTIQVLLVDWQRHRRADAAAT
ncbi:MAG TPA: AI-2E family transporter, partial [Gaiellaceae bacterium]|nr:AI-2E family transporter [Gaiellaceae bacterium]